MVSQAHSGIWFHRLLDSETDRPCSWGKGPGAGIRGRGHSAKGRVRTGAGLTIQFPMSLCFRNEQEGNPHEKDDTECAPKTEAGR